MGDGLVVGASGLPHVAAVLTALVHPYRTCTVWVQPAGAQWDLVHGTAVSSVRLQRPLTATEQVDGVALAQSRVVVTEQSYGI